MPQLYPEANFSSFTIEKIPGTSHYHDWVDGALAGTKTTDSFEYACPLTEAVNLGNIATRFPGVALEWDATGLRFPNHLDAEKLLTREYREGWMIEPVAV
jgi:hypothetical protein